MSETEPKKWTSTAGPIQTKRASGALSAIMQEGRTFIEKYGVIGCDESESVLYSPFSPARKEATDAWTALGDKFSWAITRENYQDLIAGAADAVKALRQSRPVDDKRRTAEQDAENLAKRQQVEAEREAKEAEVAAARDALIPQLMAKYPWAIARSSETRDAVRTAQNIKIELCAAFPGVVFSVRTENGYDSLRLRWELGPTEQQVNDLVAKYKNATYTSDGGDGYYERDHSASGAALDVVLGRVRFISCSRDIPEAVRLTVAEMICKVTGVPFAGMETRGIRENDGYDTLGDYTFRLIANTTFPAGAKILSVRDVIGELHAFHKEMHGVYGDGWLAHDKRGALSPEHAKRLADWEATENDVDRREGFELAIEAPEVLPNPLPTGEESRGGVRFNRQHNGIELHFDTKPPTEVIRQIKVSGYRWFWTAKFWYTRYSPAEWVRAHQLLGLPVAPEPVAQAQEPDRFDMAVEDQMKETCGL